MRATAIMAHPYHWDVIGWMSDILSWKRDEIIAYYRTFYAPNNAVLVVVGDFRTAALLELIRKYYGAIPARPTAGGDHGRTAAAGARRVVMRKEAQTATYIRPSTPRPSATPISRPCNCWKPFCCRAKAAASTAGWSPRSQLAVEVWGGISETIDPLLVPCLGQTAEPAVDPARIESSNRRGTGRRSAGTA